MALAAGALAAVVVAHLFVAQQIASRDADAPSAQNRSVAHLALPVPLIEQVEAAPSPCESHSVTEAIADTDPTALIAAFGGAERLREVVAEGAAPCVPLDDPAWPWAVVNKQRPLEPVDYAPEEIVAPPSRVAGDGLRPEAIEPFERLVAAAEAEGAGRIASFSAYRSYETQESTYRAQVGARGEHAADEISAHPGFSEHQLGLAVDVVACDAGGCGTIYEVGETAQGRWLADNAWRFGWIVRYEPGETETTGYAPEPWHLRYIGEDLAAVYRDGGFRSLEEFFGLPAAPDYG
ncbi:hypothetical protein GCM10010921_15020 [Microbacterium album]|uniref:D-alanyl-D-alanine carboxypeptidase-like core domain-containing protein n=2 Tax=Microbacterium album TaxID=2053191 RepID=A0A917IG40_9MICO|nr:hypothetical protein GCM10010921_15020 [Microbacterium album]